MYKYLSKTIMMAVAVVLAAFAQNVTTFTDKRDGKTYKIVKIGLQTWFAENLNFNAKGSVCYDNKPENCARFGRRYDWNTAIKACPAGWHLPAVSEWTTLTYYVGGGVSKAGTKLKSKTGWNSYNGVPNKTTGCMVGALPVPMGTDDFGFSAMSDDGYNGYWWSATECNAYCAWKDTDTDDNFAWSWIMSHQNEVVYKNSGYKTNRLSVRCIQD